MLARSYISDNANFPDVEFHQIVAYLRRLKPVCDKLTTASAANTIASMQAIDAEVLQFGKDSGQMLTKTSGNNDNVPPPGSWVPTAQVIVNRILIPLNAPPQCQSSIAPAVPNASTLVQSPPKANAPEPAWNVPAPLVNP